MAFRFKLSFPIVILYITLLLGILAPHIRGEACYEKVEKEISGIYELIKPYLSQSLRNILQDNFKFMLSGLGNGDVQNDSCNSCYFQSSGTFNIMNAVVISTGFSQLVGSQSVIKGCFRNTVYAAAAAIKDNVFGESFTIGGSFPNVYATHSYVLPSMSTIGGFLKLSSDYYRLTGNDEVYKSEIWNRAFQILIEKVKSAIEGSLPVESSSWGTNEAQNMLIHGFGSPYKKSGLMITKFKPSGVASIFPYNVPVNYLAGHFLKEVAEDLHGMLFALDLAAQARTLGETIVKGILSKATFQHKGKLALAQEIDGFGSQYRVDEGHFPFLLSLHTLGVFEKNNELFVNTKDHSLSKSNAFYFQKDLIGGNGSSKLWIDRILVSSLLTSLDSALTDDEFLEFASKVLSLRNEKNLFPFYLKVVENNRDSSNAENFPLVENSALFIRIVMKLYRENIKLLAKLIIQ